MQARHKLKSIGEEMNSSEIVTLLTKQCDYLLVHLDYIERHLQTVEAKLSELTDIAEVDDGNERGHEMDDYTIDEWIDDSCVTAELLDGQDIEDVYCWDYALNAASKGKVVWSVGEWAKEIEYRFEMLEEQRVELMDESGDTHWHIMRWHMKDADERCSA